VARGRRHDCLDDESVFVRITDEQLLETIEQRSTLSVGYHRRAAKEEFESFKPFKFGMAPEDVEAAANDLLTQHRRASGATTRPTRSPSA
jgi:hypothetical protein